MEWEKEASTEIKKVPFFIRKRVKDIIEKRVAEKGLSLVTVKELESARGHFFKKSDKENPATVEEDIKLYEVKICGGEKVSCPFMIGSAEPLVEKISAYLEATEFTKKRMAKAEGLILPHHKFKVSISTCPNGCSQPQIKDIGIILQAVPEPGKGDCNNCRLCAESCKEEAITIEAQGTGFSPTIDFSRCLNCGICTRACTRNALVNGKVGYKLLAGGRLGRHPRLAKEIIPFGNEEEILAEVKNLITTFLEKGKKDQKMADIINA